MGNLRKFMVKNQTTINVMYLFVLLDFSLVLTFPEGVQMLRDQGIEIGDEDDLSTPNEKLLGRLVKAKVGTSYICVCV